MCCFPLCRKQHEINRPIHLSPSNLFHFQCCCHSFDSLFNSSCPLNCCYFPIPLSPTISLGWPCCLCSGCFTAMQSTSPTVCMFIHMNLECGWICVCLQTFLYSAWLSNLFWFCLVSRTRSQLPFKGQIGAKWAALSYRGNRLNKALGLHHWLSHTKSRFFTWRA